MPTPTAGNVIAPIKPAVVNQAPIVGDTGTGLIGQAATYTPTDGTATANLTGTGYTGATATGNGYNSTDWADGEDQTVSGQVRRIIDENGPLSQRATARAQGEMNARGLINTSIGVGAEQAALYDAALPIAQQDAATAANRGQFNAGQRTSASQFGAAAGNTANLANQQSTNQASAFTAGAKDAASAANQAATNQQNLVNQSSRNEALAQGAAATNSLQTQTNALRQQAAQGNQDAANKLVLLDMDNQFKASIANADAANKVQLQELADSAKAELASIDANYRTLIQASATAGGLYESAVNNIARIAADPNMDAASKAATITAIQNHLKSSLNVIGSINAIDIGSLLDFGAAADAADAGSGDGTGVPA